MSETRKLTDPFTGQEVEISNNLIDRLHGKYACGPTLENGEPEFGWRQMPTVPIQIEAATEIVALHILLARTEAGANRLREKLNAAVAMLDGVEVFVKTKERISHPTGAEWFDNERANLRAVLAVEERE